MKLTKKLLALLLALLMLASVLVMPAVADTTGGENQGSTTSTPIGITITSDKAGHTYKAYQVFTGTLSDDGVLSDVQWGEGVDGAALLAGLKINPLFLKGEEGAETNVFSGCYDAGDVAKVLSGWSYNEASVKNFADEVKKHVFAEKGVASSQVAGGYFIDVQKAGYYLVVDETNLDGDTNADAATDLLLQVVGSVNVTPKISHPTFKKTVNNELKTSYQEAMDVQIGDVIYFKLETKLPSLYLDYKQYMMVMEDTMPDGLEFGAVEDIYVAHAAGGQTSYLTAYHEKATGDTALTKWYHYDADNKILTVNFGDLRDSQENPNLNDTFVVKYSATVTNAVVYGKNGELGNVNHATLHFSNDMNQEPPTTEAEATAISMGVLRDSANVYVYQLEVTKVDSLTKNALKDAKFYLYRNVSNIDGSITKMYADIEYVDGSTSFGKITGWKYYKPDTMEAEHPLPLISGEDGKFTIQGLDSLAYHLEEVEAPKGYNKMEEAVLVTLSATISDHELTALSCTADGTTSEGNVDTGLVAVMVNNTAGSTLPETGGMGTTIFYVVGGVLLLAVAVILVTKKRREA